MSEIDYKAEAIRILETIEQQINQSTDCVWTSIDGMYPNGSLKALARLAKMGLIAEAKRNDDQIQPINDHMEPEEALRVVSHLTVFGQKAWFDGQKCADAVATVERLARLGVVCERSDLQTGARNIIVESDQKIVDQYAAGKQNE